MTRHDIGGGSAGYGWSEEIPRIPPNPRLDPASLRSDGHRWPRAPPSGRAAARPEIRISCTIEFSDWIGNDIPSGKLENHHAINGKIHYFDWATLNSFLYVYQRVPIKTVFLMLNADSYFSKKWQNMDYQPSQQTGGVFEQLSSNAHGRVELFVWGEWQRTKIRMKWKRNVGLNLQTPPLESKKYRMCRKSSLKSTRLV